MGGFLAFDDVYQRLFMIDGAFGGPPGNRIVTWDVHPDRITDTPEATHVIGQPDFNTRTPGSGSKKFGGGYIAIDKGTQYLFKLDGGNNRVLVFDIHPDRISNYPDANFVIGQIDFESQERGIGQDLFNGPSGIAIDDDRHHLYIADRGNNRILVFDIAAEQLRNKPQAIAVIGQADFQSRELQFAGATEKVEDQRGLRKATPHDLGFDSQFKRLFISQPEENRVLVFDMANLEQAQNPDAIAVIGQPNFTSFEPLVSQSRIAWPKPPVVDSAKQLLYISEGFEGGNRVITFDIHPDRLTNGPDAVDIIGHIDDQGRLDYDRRNANDRLNGKFGAYVRSVELDTVDHRLFAADEYNNRVMVYQLDAQNRLLDREAQWVLGQEDVYSAVSIRSATTMRIPLALAYDKVDKRLYVGDSWNDRILIYDVNPDNFPAGGGHEAVAVLGQADFTSQDPRTTQNRMDFAVTRGRGIASSLIPVGITIDEERRLAFVSDGGNNRVLVFDIAKETLVNGADAIAVLGQEDFTSKEIDLSAAGMSSPGHLNYDQDNDRLFVVDSLHHRILVFDVGGDNLRTGMTASLVIGQEDFTSTLPPQTTRRYVGETTERNLPFPNGIEYDPAKQRLYVSDRGNDRVLVFDASPENLRNNPTAIAVLGQTDEVSHTTHQESDFSGQDQLYDARGMSIDSENQLLYVSDSHFARIMAFNFPNSQRRVAANMRGSLSYNTLDAYSFFNPEKTQSGFAVLQSSSDSNASFSLTRTIFEREAQTQRLSRHLISQTAAPAPQVSTRSLVFTEARDGANTTLFVANPGDQQVTVDFVLQALRGRERSASMSLPAGGSLSINVTELMETRSATGALTVTSSAPVAVTAWVEVENRHGEKLLNSLPVVRGDQVASSVLPNLMAGGGYESEVVLLNASSELSQGNLLLFDEDGQELTSRSYSINPGGVLVWEVPRAGVIPSSRYAITQNTSGSSPALAALVKRSDDGLITTTTIESFNSVTHARIPLNTMPDLIRHRRDINMQLTIANPGLIAATVRFILRDLDGNIVDRLEQSLLGGLQRSFSFSGLFNRQQFAGTVAIASDHNIGVSAQLHTVNLRGDEILTELPVLSGASTGKVVYPYLDGAGISTEMIISAGDETELQTRLEFFTPNGEVMEVIVR